jgi:putative ABC transport system substrate-binding protein
VVSEQLQAMPETQALPLVISQETTTEQAQRWLKSNHISSIITLGRSSLRFAQKLNQSQAQPLRLIAGGVAEIPDGISGISLNGDPEHFIELIKSLTPHITTISLVYSKTYNGWWLQEARSLAEKHQLILNAVAVTSLRDGVKEYKRIVDNAHYGTEAIWIPLRDIIPNKTIMPLVLKQAWDKKLVIFSNNPLHAKQGALFALFPDSNNMAKQLAELAQKQARGNQPPQINNTLYLNSAINTRTAKHLGVNIKNDILKQFDRIYPLQ